LGVTATASANPRALPFTYTTDTLTEGGVEIEQFADLVPLRSTATSGAEQRYLGTQFQTEIEVGIKDRLELGLYFTFAPPPPSAIVPTTAASMPESNGLKQRLRYILADLGEWPVDVGVYGEITENDTEIELEGKLLLQRRFDRLRIAGNVTVEYELDYDGERDVIFNPSLGATYEVTPRLHVGVDSWLRGEYDDKHSPMPLSAFGLGPEVYVGPAVLYSFGKLWWSVGAYFRVTDTDHTVADGEVYGPMWFRSMIGYELR
jgi:hypothetical protein